MMSDRLSPENLGKELYVLHEIFLNNNTPPEGYADWNMYVNNSEKQSWIHAAEAFCKYLKETEADS